MNNDKNDAKKNKTNGFWAIVSSIKMAYKLGKMAIILSIALNLIYAVSPYVAIFLSARIIDGLTAGEKLTHLLAITAVGIGIIFFAQLLERHIEKTRNIQMDVARHNYNMAYTKKTIEMDYAQLESPLSADILNRIRTDNTWGSGFYGIFWLTGRIFGSIFGFLAALGILIPLFASGEFFKEYMTSISFLVLLALSMSTVFFNAKYIKRKMVVCTVVLK